jgi:hypothetical protein
MEQQVFVVMRLTFEKEMHEKEKYEKNRERERKKNERTSEIKE